MGKKAIFFCIAVSLLSSIVVTANPVREDPEMRVYPNPVSDQLNIWFEAKNTVVPEIRILDLTGKVVREFESPFTLSDKNFRANIDVSDLNEGIYFVKVTQGEKVYTKKLVVR